MVDLQMRHFTNPDDMHRQALTRLEVAITWNAEGDPVNDLEHYTESFDVQDNWQSANNRTGLTRQECEEHIHNLLEEQAQYE